MHPNTFGLLLMVVHRVLWGSAMCDSVLQFLPMLDSIAFGTTDLDMLQDLLETLREYVGEPAERNIPVRDCYV